MADRDKKLVGCLLASGIIVPCQEKDSWICSEGESIVFKGIYKNAQPLREHLMKLGLIDQDSPNWVHFKRPYCGFCEKYVVCDNKTHTRYDDGVKCFICPTKVTPRVVSEDVARGEFPPLGGKKGDTYADIVGTDSPDGASAESPDGASTKSQDEASAESPDEASAESPDGASTKSQDEASAESPDGASLISPSPPCIVSSYEDVTMQPSNSAMYGELASAASPSHDGAMTNPQLPDIRAKFNEAFNTIHGTFNSLLTQDVTCSQNRYAILQLQMQFNTFECGVWGTLGLPSGDPNKSGM